MVRSHMKDRPFWIVNGIVSAIALAVLAYLLLIRRGTDPNALAFMPAVNASFNAMSAALLVLAVRTIRRDRKDMVRHRRLVLGAFACSVFFLAGYLAYHYVHGDTRYPGTGPVRVLYLLFLASHVLLSIPVVPLCLAAFYFALRSRFAVHTRITRILYPMWLYVSVTGVLVFVWLHLA